ncbi:hypothetical protein [Sedimenticola selenatireducens]|nr:hypothetical protein [Sedimenticola selenatireducens]
MNPLPMLFAGISPGIVLMFLLADPASNIAGLVLVRRELAGKMPEDGSVATRRPPPAQWIFLFPIE